MKRCSLLQTILVVVVFLLLPATFHRTIAETIDPPIPCRILQDCPVFSNTLNVEVRCVNDFCECKNGTEIRNCSSTEITQHVGRNAESPVFRICKLDQDCKMNNSICNTTISQCACQKDHVLSSNKQACLKKAEGIDFSCIDDNQCLAYLPNTTCQNGMCNCIRGYHYVKTACYKTIDFGGSCAQSEECSHVDGAVCNEKHACNCPAETVISARKDRCFPAAREILEPCSEDVQCSTTFPDAACIEKRCRCSKGYHFESELSRCYLNTALDDNCANTHDCYQSGDENSTTKAVQCLQSVCACAEDFYREEDKCIHNGGAAPATPWTRISRVLFFTILASLSTL